MAHVYVGCSGWNYDHWRDVFYPRGLGTSHWLEHYAGTLETVEVNATFYRLPTRKTAAGWAKATPDGFVFAVKASRYLTHVKRLRDVAERLATPQRANRATLGRRQARARPVAASWELP